MQDQLNRIESKVDTQIEHQKAMHRRLFGDEKLKQEGLVDVIERNTKARKQTSWIIGLAAGIGTGFSYLWHKIAEFFNHI